MPNLPISQLPQSNLPLDGTEIFPLVQGGITKYTTLNSLIYAPGATYGVYNQTTNSTPVTNTLVESSLIDGGVGSLTIPANLFRVGEAFHAILTGHISCVNNHTLRIRIKAGSSILADTGLISMALTTTKHWKLEVFFTINQLGIAGVGSISTGGSFTYTKDASSAFEGVNFSYENNTTFNTTIDNTLSITAQWGTADPGDSIYSNICTLIKTY